MKCSSPFAIGWLELGGKMERLTKPQMLIYDMEKMTGGTISVICGSILIQGQKSIENIKQVISKMYQQNQILRMQISEIEGIPYQYEVSGIPTDIEVLTFDNKKLFDDYAQTYAKIPMNLYGNLSEFKIIQIGMQYGLLVKMHHIIGDAWALTLLAEQFNTLMQGESIESFEYTEYVREEERYCRGNGYKKDIEYFKEQFCKCEEVLFLSDKMSSERKAKRKTVTIDEEFTKQILWYCREKDTSVFVLFMTLFATYFNRIKNNAQKFYLGTTFLNRRNYKEKHTMGMYVNTIPVLMELDNQKTFAENQISVADNVLAAMRHQRCNYGEILREIRREYQFKETLYDVIINYQNAKILNKKEQIETTWYPCGEQNESLQIHIEDRDNEEVFRIHYDYQVEKFEEKEIGTMHQRLMVLLKEITQTEPKKLFESNIMLSGEKKKIVCDFNNTKEMYENEKTIYDLLEEQIVEKSDKIAIIADNIMMTYKEMGEKINTYCSKLQAMGIKKNQVVGIHLNRGYQLIVFQFAVLKAGAIFLPIDKRYPYERIEYMCNDCKVQLLISDELTKIENTRLITLEEFQNYNYKENGKKVQNKGVCYIIYTSGSTGTPKGCMLRGEGIVNFCKNNNTLTTLRKKAENVFACVNSVSFDYFIAESLLPLLNGYTTVILSEEESTNQKLFLESVKKNKINVLMTTPTRLKIFFDDQNDCTVLRQFDCVCTSGEALPPELLEIMYEKSPKAQIYNPLGPSECTVWVLGGELTREKGIDIHIGKPIANSQIYILDTYGQVVPIGVIGEIYIGGVGVGAGYLNQSKLTKEKFVENPFGTGKLYKTGDLAYWREDGNIVYVGRNDFQVKIRGLRIELGEIENELCKVEGIHQVVVVPRKDKDGRQFICAFYTGEKLLAKHIRKEISKNLPTYMLPHTYTHLNKMPLTSSGKMNRKMLPEISLQESSNRETYMPPQTEKQKVLCSLMEETLGIEKIGLDDNFFELGGDSLKAIEYTAKAYSNDIAVNIQQLYDYPTVRSLSEYLQKTDRTLLGYNKKDVKSFSSLLENNTKEKIKIEKKKNMTMGTLLLAGATGYLGIHILKNFLDNDTGNIYCLVRGMSKHDCEKRMENLFVFYFGKNSYEKAKSRVKVLCADVSKEYLGMEKETYIDLTLRIKVVINAAASVKHYGAYQDFYSSNVETTRNLLGFCEKSGAKIIHISTTSVSGNGFGTDTTIKNERKIFTEKDFYIEQPLDNFYVRSKFEAENLVLEAMQKGMSGNIMRMGNLTNRLDGKFQKNYESNAFFMRLRAICDLGIVSQNLLKTKIEFTPVDEAANAVMTIIRNFSNKYNVFHVNHPKSLSFAKLIEFLGEIGLRIQIVDEKTFSNTIKESGAQNDKKYIQETFVTDINESKQLSYESNIQMKNDFTVSYLEKLGFEWPDIELEYIKKYIRYFQNLGYFKKE